MLQKFGRKKKRKEERGKKRKEKKRKPKNPALRSYISYIGDYDGCGAAAAAAPSYFFLLFVCCLLLPAASCLLPPPVLFAACFLLLFAGCDCGCCCCCCCAVAVCCLQNKAGECKRRCHRLDVTLFVCSHRMWRLMPRQLCRPTRLQGAGEGGHGRGHGHVTLHGPRDGQSARRGSGRYGPRHMTRLSIYWIPTARDGD